jgi:hypothetical protein
MIRRIYIFSFIFLFLPMMLPTVNAKKHFSLITANAYAEEEKPEAETPETPELDEKEYFSNPHYDLEERHFNESERNFDEPDKYDYYEKFDEKEDNHYR